MTKPLTIVIFGASGDLTARKLMPALFSLFRKGKLPKTAQIVGAARSPLRDEQFRDRLKESVQKTSSHEMDAESWPAFARLLTYSAADATASGGLDRLNAWLRQREGSDGGDRLYYLAVAPELTPLIVQRLGEQDMNREDNGWRRIVIEKPFGRDRASAQALNQLTHRHFAEQQIYRIDHYLGKETVQNLLVFRFANTLFEPVWNHRYIDHVQISVAEAATVGGRAGYYDSSGVIRDMIQSHLLQLLAVVAMEAPARFAADTLRNEKVKLFDAIPVPTATEAAAQVVCGQYQGYRQESGVAVDSRTATFAAIRLTIENWRWRGVPFYLRSGKGMRTRSTEIVIQFHCPPHMMFSLPKDEILQCNRLAICIQPDEGIHLNFQTKVPAEEGVKLRPADLEFHYRSAYPGVELPEAYERLLLDVLTGDAALFMRSDEIERCWEIVDPLIAAVERAETSPPVEYPVGSDGPETANDFLGQEGRKWVTLCQHLKTF